MTSVLPLSLLLSFCTLSAFANPTSCLQNYHTYYLENLSTHTSTTSSISTSKSADNTPNLPVIPSLDRTVTPNIPKVSLKNPVTTEHLATALKDLPKLRSYIQEIIDDPQIPRSIKRILQIGLVEKKTEVINLTKRIRTIWNVPAHFEAFAASNSDQFKQFRFWTLPDPKAKTLNADGADKINTQFSKGGGIAVTDAKISKNKNSVEALIHELAHIRFHYFLQKNWIQIAERLPRSFAFRGPDGHWYINDQFIGLIDEKYAYASQFLLSQKFNQNLEAKKSKTTTSKNETSKNSSDESWGLEGDLKNYLELHHRDLTPEEVTSTLGEFLSRDFDAVNESGGYGYNQPLVAPLAHLPLRKLLLASMEVKEVDEVFNSYHFNNDLYIKTEEMFAMLSLARIFKNHLGIKVSEIPSIEKLASQLIEVKKLNRGKQRVTAILDQLISPANEHLELRSFTRELCSHPQIMYLMKQIKYQKPDWF